MKKSNSFSSRRTMANSNRRRQLLKRVHQKVVARRHTYQGIEISQELAEAC
jgi:hypothetical protein